MRSLYWKIFLSFWLATILIILTTAWVTSEIAQKSSVPVREQVFMDSYANAAVATYESGHLEALTKWLENMGTPRQITLYLLSNTGEIIGNEQPPEFIKEISASLVKGGLNEGMLKFDDIIVSHEIHAVSGKIYRLAAVSAKPLAYFIQIPWAGLTIRLIIATFISGLICYLLSVYLTQPLRSLRLAAKSIATGKLNTRVGSFKGHYHDEIAQLSDGFDRMAEKLETIISSKERLLQDISHELRSPLARMQVALELGRKKAYYLASAEFSRMDEECLRLNNLIGEIIAFTRLDSSSITLNKTKIDLVILLKDIIADANYEFGYEEPKVILQARKSYNLALDKRLIHSAIENIIRNALHYSTPEPKVVVSLQVDKSNSQIYIDVTDNGSGIPEGQLDKIFNPFYRVDTAREKKTGGYGLGLSIALQAVKLHQGTIQASNRKNGGLLIRIILPISKEAG